MQAERSNRAVDHAISLSEAIESALGTDDETSRAWIAAAQRLEKDLQGALNVVQELRAKLPEDAKGREPDTLLLRKHGRL